MLYSPGYKAFLAVPCSNSICFFSLFSCNLLFPQLCLSIQTLTLISELSTENKKKERRKEVGFDWGFFPPKIILESHKQLHRCNHASRIAANCQFT